MEHWVWGLTLDTVGLTSVILLTRKRRLGWLISLFNLLILWTAYAIWAKQWGFFPGIAIHAFFAWRGWVRWSRDDQSL